jgi:hypothetical protein
MKLVPKKETCATKIELLAAYQIATKLYSDAIAELAQKIGIVPKAEYDDLNLAGHKARRRSANALEVLEAHTEEHGC